MSDTANYMPPIAIGVGALLPGLMAASPFQVPPQLKGLLSIIGFLFCWMAYFLVSSLGVSWSFAPVVTLLAIAGSILLLLVVALRAWVSPDCLERAGPFVLYLVGQLDRTKRSHSRQVHVRNLPR
jgi:ABC-type protease/lipase transport system fused ATPase/permease subunit